MKLPVSWDDDFFHINLYSWRHWWRQQVTKKVQFWNCNISINISDTASIKISKYRKCSWLSSWYIQLPVLLPVNKFVATSKWRPFWKIWNIKHSFNFTSAMWISSQIMPKNIFHGDDVIDDVIGWPESCPLYSCLGEARSGSKLQGLCPVSTCEYRNRLSRLYMPKGDLNK